MGWEPLPLTPSHLPQSSSPLLLSLNNLEARQEQEAAPCRRGHHLFGCPAFCGSAVIIEEDLGFLLHRPWENWPVGWVGSLLELLLS